MKKNILLFFTFLIIRSALGQIDTVFWFAAPWVTPDHWHREPIRLHIATFSAPSTTVRVRQPAAIAPNKYDTTIILGPNTSFDYTFWRDALVSATNMAFDSLECRPANTVLPYGLYISSSSNITVVYDVVTRPPNHYNCETFSLKGSNGIGNEFVCPFQTNWWNQTVGDLGGTPPGAVQPKQQINIVATKPNTVVWIKPACNVVGHPANVTYSVLLPNPGDCYTIENTVQNTNVAGNNLSGTIVYSDKPIAVTVADDSVRTPGGGCYDLIGDQIVPVDIVGKDYIVNRGSMNVGSIEGIYVVGTENFTSLTINDGVITNTIINKGQTFFYNITQPLTYVQANKNVYVWQATGIGCEAGAALLPPLSCAGSSLVAFSRNSNQQFRLNILVPTGAQNSFTLNGSTTLVPGTAFNPVPGTGGQWMGAQIPLTPAQLPIGSYTIGNSQSDFALGVFDGGATTGGLFHYMSSFLRRTEIKTQTVSPVCVGSTFTVPLTGTISGGAITGIWTTANGTGTFGAYSSTVNTISTTYTLSNIDTTQQFVKFYLTSTGNCVPVKDSIMVQIVQRPKLTVTSTVTAQCKNNISPIQLTGTFSNCLGANWTGGAGGTYGPPGVNTTYTPSPLDLANGSIVFTLSAQGGCSPAQKTYTVSFVNPPTVNLITNTFVCTNSNTIALTGTVTGSNISYMWNTNGTGIFTPGSNSLNTVYNLSASDLQQPSVQMTLTAIDNSGLCASVSNTMNINVLAQPVITVAPTFTICSNTTLVVLSGSVSGGGASALSWTTTNGSGAFTPVPPTNANYAVAQNDTLLNTPIVFVVQSTNGFCPSVKDTVRMYIIKLPNITVNSNTAVCESNPIFLNGSVSGYTNTGFWTSTGTGSFSPNNNALNGIYYPSTGDLAAGSVTITLTSSTVQGISCPAATKSFVANFVQAPDANFAVSPKRCLNDPVTFTNTSAANNTTINSVSWNFGNGITSGANNPNTTYTNTGYHVITLTVTGTNSLGITCSDTISKSIIINNLPIPNFSVNNACEGMGTNFTNLSNPASALFSWFFGNNASPATSTITNPQGVVFNSSGTFNVDLTMVSPITQCSASITQSVSINPKPNADFQMTNNPTVAEEPVYFSDFSTPSASVVSWVWNFGDGSTSLLQNPSHTYLNGGTYTIVLLVFDNLGCKDSAVKTIDVNLLPQVPTGFSPNGDGKNDVLYVKGGPFKRMLFRVYNNWGEKIFESTDQSQGWDGKKNGEDQPLGVYVWTLEADLYNNRTVRLNGDVTLIR
jgi:gliding motility-associated-like protein